jgi:pyruvate dehydrogenase E1 component alpha subunit
VAEWLTRDPFVTYRERLIGWGVEEHELDRIESEAMADVDAATEDAKAAPTPSVEKAFADVWADGGASWRNS